MRLRCVTYFRIPGKRLASQLLCQRTKKRLSSDTFEPAAPKSDFLAALLSQRTEKQLATEPKNEIYLRRELTKKRRCLLFGGDTSLLGALSSASGLLLCAEALALFANVVSQ